MAEAPAAAVEFVAEKMMLREDLLEVLTAGNAARLTELLRPHGQRNGHVALHVHATAAPDAAPPPLEPGTGWSCLLGLRSIGNTALHRFAGRNVEATAKPDVVAPPLPPCPVTSSCLLGVMSNGNTALHVVASRGHAKLAALICEKAPSLVATSNRGLDTPLHCAARGGHREVAACLLSTMLNAGVEAAGTLQAKNRLGYTALHEAVLHGREGVVDLLMTEAPELASLTSDDCVSPLYMAAIIKSVQMVRLLLRPLSD